MSGEAQQQQKQNEEKWPHPRQEECPGDSVEEEGGGAHLFKEKDPSNSVFIKCCFHVSFLFKALLKIVIHHFDFMRTISTIILQ